MRSATLVRRKERRWALLWSVLIVGLACLPYVIAWLIAPADTQYTGLLVNHYDGESYYAKIQQGARGDWLFHLPFTSEPHEGAFVYTFYLALGHLAAALGLPIPLVYHLTRVCASLFLLLVAYRFVAQFFDHVRTRQAAFLLLGFSSGFGWLAAPLGLLTADLWVAEGFTFLSILVNPHFPLTIGLMLLIFLGILDQWGQPPQVRRFLESAVLGLVLAVVQPLAILVVLVVLGVYLVLVTWRERRLPWGEIVATGAVALAAAPIMLYDLYAFNTNPALSAWSAQNLTLSLPPWDYGMGYGLILLLALGGIVFAFRCRQSTDLFLIAWTGSVVILLYLPFALQRRFITGFHVPLTLLAALGLEQIVWPRIPSKRRALVTNIIIAFTALTNVFVPVIAVAGMAREKTALVMSRDEVAACNWLAEHTAWTDTVFAPVESAQFIPAWAGNRTVYGHPFETIDAETKETETVRFFSPETTNTDRRTLLDRYGVRYVLVTDPKTLPDTTSLGLSLVWSGDKAALYRVEAGP
jgi:hypothetical protein